MESLFPTISLTFSQRQRVCVLDPVLLLCDRGLEALFLTKNLSTLMELWVVRELWHILDNTLFYIEHIPDVSLPVAPADRASAPKFDERAINAWEQLRLKTDLAGLNIFWMGDSAGQSCLPKWIKEGVNPEETIARYELLARSLDSHLSESEIRQPLHAACRDAIALAATLGSATILTYRPTSGNSSYIVDCLERWGIGCHQQPDSDPIVAIERQHLQHLFVHAGVSQLLWSDLDLVVLHLIVPAALHPSVLQSCSEAGDPDDREDFEHPWTLLEDDRSSQLVDIDLWQQARGYWYPIQVEKKAFLNHEHSSERLLQALASD
ncbi:MAG: hypothetical protein AB4050_13300 [Synechococcus sp.]